MSKQLWKPGTLIYPLPAVIVSCGDFIKKENLNILTIAWTGTINTNPPMTYISIRPSRFSYEIIKITGEFVINLTTKSMVFATDYAGVTSGKMLDKAEKLHLTYEQSNFVNAPSIKESPVNIECKVFEVKELGSHHMFLANVLAVNVDDSYIDENNKFHLEQAKPICYSHGNYYELGQNLGKFGYSVQKKKLGEGEKALKN